MSCITIEDATIAMRNIARADQLDRQVDKEVRVDLWKITDDQVMEMFENMRFQGDLSSSKRIQSKMEKALNILPKFHDDVRAFVKQLTENTTGAPSNKAARHQAIALQEVIESIKGEVNKVGNNNLKIQDVSGDGVLPNLPLPRLAASIGRKIAYAEGMRFHKVPRKDGSYPEGISSQVEHSYYVVGLQALENLQKNKMLNIEPAGSGTNTIKDYLNDINENPNANTDVVTDQVPAIVLNYNALGIKRDSSGQLDGAVEYFYNPQNANLDKHVMGAYVKALRAMNLVSQPENIYLPSLEPIDPEMRRNRDVYAPSGKVNQSRELMEQTPVFINRELHGFFKLLHEQLKDGDTSASRFIAERLNNESLQNLFEVRRNNRVASYAPSFSGQNLSKTTPIDDVVEYYDALMTAEGDAAGLYMAMFAGRNARMYYENSVVNPHASKLMRYALASAPYDIEVGSEQDNFYIQKVAIAMGMEGNPQALLDSGGVTDSGKALNKALKLFKQFQDAKSASKKLQAMNGMQESLPGLNFSQLITGLEAIQGIRDSRTEKTYSTTFMVSSDATASGGGLTLKQALGSQTGGEITDLLRRLSLLRGKSLNDDPLDDIYALLQNRLDGNLMNDEGYTNPNDEEAGLLKQIQSELFNGKIRDLSKKPTMTFIYQQARGGARNSLSDEFTRKTIDKLQKNKVSDELIAMVNKLVPDDVPFQNTPADLKRLRNRPNLQQELYAGFAESGVPDFLYTALTEALTREYLDPYIERADKIFKFFEGNPKVTQMRVFPAATVVEAALRGDDLKYDKRTLRNRGIPMTKIHEVLNEVQGDSVLNQEERVQKTIMLVSFIHGIDTSNMFLGVNEAMKEFGHSLISVHDDIRTTVPALMQAEKDYMQADRDAAYHFDLFEQVMEAGMVYDPSLNGNAEYTKLLDSVRAGKQQKQEIIDAYYDFETSSVIGDKISSDPLTKPKPKRKKSFKNLTDREALNELAPDSEIIQGFLKDSGQSKLARGDKPEFDPQSDTVVISNVDTRTGKKQSINTKSGRKNLIEMVEHEIVHSYTAGLVIDWFKNRREKTYADPTSPQNDINLGYIDKSFVKLLDMDRDGRLEKKLAPTAYNRMQYAFDQEAGVGLAEFISIMSTEPDTAKQVYKALSDRPRLQTILEKVVNAIREIVRLATFNDLVADPIDPEILYSSINAVIAEGQTGRRTNPERLRELQKMLDGNLFLNKEGSRPGPIGAVSDTIDALNAAVAIRINDPLLRKADSLSEESHDWMKRNFPLYLQASRRAKRIYDDSSELQGIMQKLTQQNVDLEKKNKVLSWFNAIRADKNELTSEGLKRFAPLMAEMNDQQQKDFYDFTHRMAMQDYFLAVSEDKITNIDDALVMYQKKIPGGNNYAQLQTIVDMNVHDRIAPGTAYNVLQVFPSRGEAQTAAKRWVALKTIKELGIERFEAMSQNQPLMDAIRDVVLAQEHLHQRAEIQGAAVRDNKVIDYYSENIVKKAITPEELTFYLNEERSGWKILQMPTDKEPGLVYQDTVDGTYIEGAFTDIRLQSGDIDVDKRFKNSPRVVKVGDGYKYIMTEQQKQKLGMIPEAHQGLVRSMTHTMGIADSMNIRDTLLERETYWDMRGENTDALVAKIKDPNQDHPWFLGGDPEQWKTMPAKIRERYMPVPKSLSDHRDFDKKIQFVRKDLSYWLVGENAPSLVKDPKLKWALRIAKDLVAGAKIGMVLLNPVKILGDNISNVNYLALRGVDPLYIQKQYRKISAEFNEYRELKNQANYYRLRSYANPAMEKKLAEVVKKMEAHPAQGLVDRGFINSLGSDLVMEASDPSSGFKSDIDAVLKFALEKRPGKPNEAGQMIMKFANYGPGVEELMEIWAKPFGVNPSTRTIERELNNMADRFRHIKSEKDLIAYMSQYLTSPDSEFVKLGTHMTDLTDITARETLYRYLTDVQGMDPKEAELDVIRSFPDYKENVTLRMKQLSDVGIFPFPTWALRIHDPIFRLLRDRPVSTASDVAIQAWLDVEAPSIWRESLIQQAFSPYGIFNNPWNMIGWGSILPTKIF